MSGSEGRGRKRTSMDAILLDAAGTLIRPSEPVSETYAAVARQCGMEFETEQLAQAFDAVFGGMPALAFEWTTLDELRRLERDWWRQLVRRVVSWTGSTTGDFETFFETLYAYYGQGHAWECYPEVPNVLDDLRARDYRLAIVSNFDSRLPGILRALGIHDYMDTVIYSSAAGSAKPDPAIFGQALGALGVAPQRAIHVGDSFRADIGGATAAGIAGLLIKRGDPPAADTGQVIHNLDELLVRLDGSGG